MLQVLCNSKILIEQIRNFFLLNIDVPIFCNNNLYVADGEGKFQSVIETFDFTFLEADVSINDQERNCTCP